MKHLTPLEVISLYPRHNYTLKGLFDSRAQADPSRPFLFFEDKSWSWGEFGAAIDKTANILGSRGIRRGDRVAIMANNSHAHVLLMFALARIGAIMVPVNTEFGVAEPKYVMGHAGVSAVACSVDTLQVAREACCENIAGAELDRVIGEHPGVSEVAAIAVEAELGEDEIMAVVLPKPGSAIKADDIRRWCAERLAAHKVPRFVVFVDELPHTPTHKVAKFLLKKDPTLRARAVDLQAP